MFAGRERSGARRRSGTSCCVAFWGKPAASAGPLSGAVVLGFGEYRRLAPVRSVVLLCWVWGKPAASAGPLCGAVVLRLGKYLRLAPVRSVVLLCCVLGNTGG